MLNSSMPEVEVETSQLMATFVWIKNPSVNSLQFKHPRIYPREREFSLKQGMCYRLIIKPMSDVTVCQKLSTRNNYELASIARMGPIVDNLATGNSRPQVVGCQRIQNQLQGSEPKPVTSTGFK